MRKALKLCLQFVACWLIVIVGYLGLWSIHYRSAAMPVRLVDLRTSTTAKPYYIYFCASLAANPDGFPGHAYVAWSKTSPSQVESADAIGFVPKYSLDQVRSLYSTVPGVLVDHAQRDNMRNFDSLVAIVDENTFNQSRQLPSRWKADEFRVGTRDCVAFTDEIARSIGLNTPSARYVFPQEYIVRLKTMNASRDATVIAVRASSSGERPGKNSTSLAKVQ